MKKIKLYYLLAAICFWTIHLHAQPRQQYVKVIVSPDHSDWLYKTGEEVNFNIKVLKDGNPITGIKVHYEIKPEMMEELVMDLIP